MAAEGADFDNEGFDTLTAIEDWHFWFGPRARLLAGLLDKHFPAATSFLEIGCGTGQVTGRVAALRRWQRIMGAEVSAHGLAYAAKRLPAGLELVQLDARAMPFRAAFDVIGCFDVLEHIAEDAAVLHGMASALRPGGGVVLSVPQHMWLWSAADTHAHHKRRYARGQLEAQCQAAGLQVIASLSYAAVTLPLMLLSRLKARASDPSQGAPDELRPNKALNAVLRSALQAEVSCSLAGLHFPIGGSRIVVAKRMTT